jgi:hypothetical protein
VVKRSDFDSHCCRDARGLPVGRERTGYPAEPPVGAPAKKLDFTVVSQVLEDLADARLNGIVIGVLLL